MANNKMRKVIDTSLKMGDPYSSRFISKDQYEKLYPGGVKRSVDLIFQPLIPILMPEIEAIQFIENYPEVLKLVDENDKVLPNKDDLDGKSYAEVKRIAQRFLIDAQNVKQDDLVLAIREARASGKEPMSEGEFDILVKRKKELREEKIKMRSHIGYIKKKDKDNLFLPRVESLLRDIDVLTIDNYDGDEAKVFWEKIEGIKKALKE